MIEDFMEKLRTTGFDEVAKIPVSAITFDENLVKYCEMNTCGNYGKNYMCPPYVGDIKTLIADAKTYENAVIFKRWYPLEDYYDFEEVGKKGAHFKSMFYEAAALAKQEFERCLILGAGGCRVCKVCAAVTNEPCRFPDKAHPSLESYGIQVTELAKLCGMTYAKPESVTFFAGVLF